MRLGADPEVFLLNPTTMSFVSVIGKVGGTKHTPLHIKGMKKGFTLQEDNVALEFGIPPAKSKEEFSEYIDRVLRAGHEKVGGLAFSSKASAYFPKEELRHPSAHQFGCEPDYNAYTGDENPRPEVEDPTFRTCGGHVHVEMPGKPNAEAKRAFVRVMDLFLGVPSLLMDSDTERRKMYGKAGALRYKPYGVEYRTLSNFWIFHPRLTNWVWDNTERAVAFHSNLNLPNEDSSMIREAIDNNNLTLAKKLVKKYELEVL